MTTRIKPNSQPDAKAKEQLANIQKMLGRTPNIFTTLAHSPAALAFCLNGAAALRETKIPGTLREQIALTVAGLNNCDYCAAAHTAIGKMEKLPESELSQNLVGKSQNAKTQAALTFAQQIVEMRGHVSDSNLEAIRKAGFSEAEIIEIVACVCQNIFTNYFNHVAGTEVDFPKVAITV